ncbi:MAG: 30S ribosomal protein S8 [Candidatus Bathyarchaeia archaeon]
MTSLNPLSNALSTIHNNEARRKRECVLWPASKLVGQVLRVMQKNGYIGEFEYIDDGRSGKFKVQLLGRINRCGAIRPSFSVQAGEIPEWERRYLPARDVGILILTTPKGVGSHREAKEQGVGGQLLAYVY